MKIFKFDTSSTRINEQNPEIVSKAADFRFSAKFLSKLSFYKNWDLTKFGWKTKIFHFRNDFWVLFIYSSGSHIKFQNFKNPLELLSRFILISRGEQVRNWARSPKTQNLKVLRFKPNFRGRLNMTSEGTPWPHSIKKHPIGNERCKSWCVMFICIIFVFILMSKL